ncbi:hypothetical protein QO021_29905 (plasmid) [Pseudomonas amygdali pv. lachrymans]|uniref:hypothetical protein n=1 Tax=Pseudomonas amygdali TaxID=47877 RepID=UPI0006B97686|nr:hypothetical protein [Pseudomonas amygdali]RMM39063.1 hypothetical protein ALQ79_200218 [Pseudomonas amygdali pv. lachrymans]WIO61303.1 hypothetical protein QO021_29905 [Pseudomonas amygdali pv. lachrymans]
MLKTESGSELITNLELVPFMKGTLLKLSGDLPAVAINPFARFSEDPYELINLIEAATGLELDPFQRIQAAEAGMLVAQRTLPNAALLVEEWIKYSDLAEFADAASRALLPV